MNVDRIIRAARRRYREDKVKLVLPERPYSPSGPDYVRASSLGLCPLQSAYEKSGVIPDFPELTIDGNDEKAWITEHGNYVAPMIQLPLMYYAMVTPDVTFVPELPFLNEAYGLVGKIDGLLTIGDEQAILEIKDTEGQQSRSVGEPKLQYALQALAYMMVMGISHASIITVSKWGWNTYRLSPEGKGFILYTDKDEVWQPPTWQTNFNLPSILNFDTVSRKLEDTHWHIGAVQHNDNPPPPLDPLNDDLSWLCLKQWDKPKQYKNGNSKEGEATPNCPFARRCHGLENQRYTTIRNPDTERIEFKELKDASNFN